MSCKERGSEIEMEWRRDHPYITSAEILDRWVQNMVIFAGVHDCIYTDIVGVSEKVHKCTDVI